MASFLSRPAGFVFLQGDDGVIGHKVYFHKSIHYTKTIAMITTVDKAAVFQKYVLHYLAFRRLVALGRRDFRKSSSAWAAAVASSFSGIYNSLE